MRRCFAQLLSLATLSLLGACGDSAAPCPPTALVAAVDVEIRAADTGSPLAAVARGAIQDGTYRDSLVPGRSVSGVLVSREAGFQRPGTYTVTVVAPGYAPWTESGVVARAGSCTVEPVSVRALLQPTP